MFWTDRPTMKRTHKDIIHHDTEDSEFFLDLLKDQFVFFWLTNMKLKPINQNIIMQIFRLIIVVSDLLFTSVFIGYKALL